MKILVFGEVLWDVYPDKKFIGGAPFNFAAHLARLGGEAYLLSAVGKDALGDETLKAVSDMGIRTDFLCRCDKPTGICRVTVSDGTPSYELCGDMAYDYISACRDKVAAIKNKSLYFGTLAIRSEKSRQTLKALLSRGGFDKIYFDINIRQSFYSADTVQLGLNACDVLKLSRDEINVFNELNLINCVEGDDKMQNVCRLLAEKYNIGKIVLTLDKDGAMIYDRAANSFCAAPVKPSKVVSTVGGGDSFFAAFSYFSASGSSDRDALDKALTLSSFVVSRTPAVPDYNPTEIFGK